MQNHFFEVFTNFEKTRVTYGTLSATKCPAGHRRFLSELVNATENGFARW